MTWSEIEPTKATDLESTEALAHLDATASTLAKASRSDATRKAYDQGWTAFETFCDDHSLVDPMAATADTVRLYMAKLASDDMAVSTIKLRLTAINRRFKSEGKPTPAAMGNSVEVIDADGRPQIQLLSDVLAGLKRSTDKTAPAKRGRRGKAKALDAGDVTAMLRLINDDSIAAARDRLLIALAFGGFLRRSELVGLDVGDVEALEDGTVRITVRSSKTDQEAEGAVVNVGKGRQIDLSALLSDWLDRSGITSGPLFRPVTKGDTIRDSRLSTRSVATIFKARAEAAGIDPTQVSGHSTRRGAATSAHRAGADMLAIARAGRWADDSAQVAGYVAAEGSEAVELGW